jgi:hypothetical protein
VAGGLLVVGLVKLIENRHLQDNGLQVEGTVIKRVHHTIDHFVDFVYVGKNDRYSLDYTYNVDGRIYTSHEIYVSKSTWDDAETNQKLPIRYWVVDPAVNQINLPDERQGRPIIPWMYIGGSALFFLLSFSRWRRGRNLSPAGVPKTATAGRAQGLRRART